MKIKVMVALLIFLTVEVNGKMYKWVDENGVTRYSQTKPEGIETSEIKVKGMPDKSDQTQSASSGSSSVLNCQQVVKHGISLMKKKYVQQSGGQTSSVLAFLDDPGFVADGVKECNKDKKDPVKAAQWLCQQNAKTFDEVEACEK